MKRFIDLNNYLRLFYQRLNKITRVDNLEYFRIILGLLFLLNFRDLSFLGEMPNSLYRPNVLNFTNLFDTWPSSIFFAILYYLRILFAITIILGIKTRLSFISLGIITIIQSGYIYSFGKIDHGVLMNILPFVMAFTDSGCKKAILPDKPLKVPDLSISILAIFITFGFFTAGLEKGLNWIDFDTNTSGFLSWLYPSYYSIGRDKLLAPLALKFPWWLTEIMDYTAVIFELTGLIFLIISRKTWFVYLVVASVFHLFNTLFLNIPFQIHILVFGIWLLTPFLKKHKILILLIPIIFYFKSIYFPLIGWILISVLGLIQVFEKYRFGFKNEQTV